MLRPRSTWKIYSSRRLSSTLSAHLGQYQARSHRCSQIDESLVGTRVSLCGWISHSRKVSKNLGFFVLQDLHGQTQLITRKKAVNSTPGGDGAKEAPGVALEVLSQLDSAPLQSVVQISGVVRHRLPSAITQEPGGAVEVAVDGVTILNPANEKLPFQPNDNSSLPAEEFRLRHRYLDLRRPELAKNLLKRSQVARTVREYLYQQEFVEVETPMLLRSTPEGAREYLVPTRLSKSESLPDGDPQPQVYALSQSPQQPKQILISSGAVERYFQFARCFRDEDGRADRQPEFTQIDLEMAWVSWGINQAVSVERPFSEWRIGGGEIKEVVEGIMRRVFPGDLTFPIMRYRDALNLYGSDKPDLRWDVKLQNITQFLPSKVQEKLERSHLAVEALIIPLSEVKDKHGVLKEYKSSDVEMDVIQPGTTWDWRSSLIPELQESPTTLSIPGTEDGAVIFTSLRPSKPQGSWTPLGRIRAALVPHFGPNLEAQKFLWVTEFPLFTRADDEKSFLSQGRWSSSHHPFTAPMVEDLALLHQGEAALAQIRGQHYDLVLNGTEIAGGSVRIHDARLQEHVFENILELSQAERAGFSELIEALKSGAPPHAGIAIGFDRLMAILCGEKSIRNVIAFPKTASGADLLFKSPTPIPIQTLELYGLRPTQRV